MMKKTAILLAALLFGGAVYSAMDAVSIVEQKAFEKLYAMYPAGARVKVTLLDKDIPSWVSGDSYIIIPASLSAITEITVADEGNSVNLRAALEASAIVLSASRNIVQGTVLQAGDITYASADLLSPQAPSYYTSGIEQLSGLKAGRPLKAGAVILSTDMERAPDVKTGAEVVIRCDYNGISVTDLGRAEEPGFTGAVIKVRNLKSKKTVMAKVMDPKTVSVEVR